MTIDYELKNADDARERGSVWATPRETAAFFGISQATLRRYVKAGIIPAPIKLSPKMTRFAHAANKRVRAAMEEGALVKAEALAAQLGQRAREDQTA